MQTKQQINVLADAICRYLDWRDYVAKLKTEQRAKAMAKRMRKANGINDLKTEPVCDKLHYVREDYVEPISKPKGVSTTTPNTEWWNTIRSRIGQNQH